jgi:hypothetical protein
VEQIRTGFPDCIARRRTATGDRSVKIEFEYRAKDFVSHGHLAQMTRRRVRKVTVICWDDNWLDPPGRVEIISLKQYLGFRRVFMMSSREKEEYTRFFDSRKKTSGWSLPTRAQRGDLILVYRTATAKTPGRIEDIVEIIAKDEGRDPKWGAFGQIRKVAKLASPIFLDDFRDDFALRRSPLKSAPYYQGRREITHLWPDVYRLVVKKNPNAKQDLRSYHPKRM